MHTVIHFSKQDVGEYATDQKKDMAILESSVGIMATYALISIASLMLSLIPGSSIFGEDGQLMAVCISGGIGGGLLSIWIYDTKSIRMVAFKWLGSTVSSWMFSPAICKYLKIESDLSNCLALSAIVGFLSWSILLLISKTDLITIIRWVIGIRGGDKNIIKNDIFKDNDKEDNQ